LVKQCLIPSCMLGKLNLASVFWKERRTELTQNTQRKWKKIAAKEGFHLYQSEKDPTRFQVRLTASGNYLRRRFNAESVDSALEMAPIVGGLKAAQAQPDFFLLDDVFTMTLENTSRGSSRKDWLYWAARFMSWLAKHHPACQQWHLITRQALREYLRSFKGKSDNTKRLAFQPIIQASAFMHRE
jgi:hypothetical protein